ncbi:hypothetical protein V8D89_005401, partial [Ganoderma adspersum]
PHSPRIHLLLCTFNLAAARISCVTRACSQRERDASREDLQVSRHPHLRRGERLTRRLILSPGPGLSRAYLSRATRRPLVTTPSVLYTPPRFPDTTPRLSAGSDVLREAQSEHIEGEKGRVMNPAGDQTPGLDSNSPLASPARTTVPGHSPRPAPNVHLLLSRIQRATQARAVGTARQPARRSFDCLQSPPSVSRHSPDVPSCHPVPDSAGRISPHGPSSSTSARCDTFGCVHAPPPGRRREISPEDDLQFHWRHRSASSGR